jgi:flagellar hook-associated protein 2
MSGGGSAISGLASGIQWRDMVDQIMSLEQSRQLDPITKQQTRDKARLAAWKSYGDVVAKLRDASNALRKGTAFTNFTATATKSPTTGISVVSATATSGAVPAAYKVEVQTLARAEKLGATAVADVNAAMGLSGDVMIGGKKLTVAAGDSLAKIRDKINALNVGSTSSRVSASILTVSSGVNRLVLTSEVGGSSGIELVENGGTNVLSSLGLVSATLVANTSGGNARSYGFDTSSTPLGQALATTMPAAGSFKVNGNRVDIDLSQDSLTAIAAKINAAAGASTATVTSEVVSGRTISRLVVTGAVTANPDDGVAAEAISTQNLQQLGFLKNDRTGAMQLVAPSDATVKIDGITVTRSTNVISDALAGVTLTLEQAEVGTTVDLTVGRDTAAAVTAVKELANAYNAASAYVATNTAEKGPLPFDSSIRSTLRQLRSVLLDDVVGLQNVSYTTGMSVGVALDKTGKMLVDEAKLKAALAASPDEVKTLFATNGTSSLSTVEYMTGTPKTLAGTYSINVTQAATTATALSSAMAGAYGNDAVANTMKVADGYTGKTSSITLTNADTASTIASKLNVAFGLDGLGVVASVTGSNELQLTGTQYGSAATVTVSFELDGVAAASQLGFNATPYAGVNVAGTINGYSATGSGRLLTADAPADGDTNDAEGLAVLYTGTTPPETASLTYVLGLGGMMYSRAEPMVQLGGGQIEAHQNVIQSAIDSATRRADAAQVRLDRQRESLIRRFTAMESALGKLQAQSNALVNQLNSLQPRSK